MNSQPCKGMELFFSPWNWFDWNSDSSLTSIIAAIASIALGIFLMITLVYPVAAAVYWTAKKCCCTGKEDPDPPSLNNIDPNQLQREAQLIPLDLEKEDPTEEITKGDYSQEEKKRFEFFLQNKQYWLRIPHSLGIHDTLTYLCNLTALYDHFSPLPYFSNRTADLRLVLEELDKVEIEAITGALVSDSTARKKTLYCLPLQMNGSHRVIVIIDLKTASVEFWDSLGGGQDKTGCLLALTENLSEKTGKHFTYIDKTKNIRLQNDNFNCGVWVSLFVERRCQNDQVCASEFKNFEISSYRDFMIKTIVKITFFEVKTSELLDAQKTCSEEDSSKITAGQRELVSSFEANFESTLNSLNLKIDPSSPLWSRYRDLWTSMFHAKNRGRFEKELNALAT